jgi:Tfp pilus assembly protein PilX
MKKAMNNKGSALILAVFIIIVIGIIGVTLMNMIVTQNAKTADEFYYVQALYDAESGAEIAIYECLYNSNCNNDTYYIKSNNHKAEIEFISTSQLNGATIYTITSLATVDNSIKRKIKVKFKN